MDAAQGNEERRDDGSKPPDRRGTPGGRARGETTGQSARTAQESRRRRGGEQRYAGWGDGLDRVYCIGPEPNLPTTFPVESHAGAATIPRVIVGRRPDALLLCNFGHCGPHIWPDGEREADDATSGSG